MPTYRHKPLELRHSTNIVTNESFNKIRPGIKNGNPERDPSKYKEVLRGEVCCDLLCELLCCGYAALLALRESIKQFLIPIDNTKDERILVLKISQHDENVINRKRALRTSPAWKSVYSGWRLIVGAPCLPVQSFVDGNGMRDQTVGKVVMAYESSATRWARRQYSTSVSSSPTWASK